MLLLDFLGISKELLPGSAEQKPLVRASGWAIDKECVPKRDWEASVDNHRGLSIFWSLVTFECLARSSAIGP